MNRVLIQGVAFVDAPNGDNVAKFALALGSLGGAPSRGQSPMEAPYWTPGESWQSIVEALLLVGWNFLCRLAIACYCLRKAKDMSIDPSEEFLNHAAECERMARLARSFEDKAAWTTMAERWQRCAEWFYRETLMVGHQVSTHRRQRGFKFLHH